MNNSVTLSIRSQSHLSLGFRLSTNRLVPRYLSPLVSFFPKCHYSHSEGPSSTEDSIRKDESWESGVTLYP